jgi:hypothetical protein
VPTAREGQFFLRQTASLAQFSNDFAERLLGRQSHRSTLLRCRAKLYSIYSAVDSGCEDVQCSNGHECGSDDAFCRVCGDDLSEASPPASTTPNAERVVDAPPPSTSARTDREPVEQNELQGTVPLRGGNRAAGLAVAAIMCVVFVAVLYILLRPGGGSPEAGSSARTAHFSADEPQNVAAAVCSLVSPELLAKVFSDPYTQPHQGFSEIQNFPECDVHLQGSANDAIQVTVVPQPADQQSFNALAASDFGPTGWDTMPGAWTASAYRCPPSTSGSCVAEVLVGATIIRAQAQGSSMGDIPSVVSLLLDTVAEQLGQPTSSVPTTCPPSGAPGCD